MDADSAGRRSAAEQAASLVAAGMTVGLGSGATIGTLIQVLAERRPAVAGYVAASPQTADALRLHDLPLVELDATEGLDLAIDGADQVTPAFWMIKGGGGAHTRERIVLTAARTKVAIAAASKLVSYLRPPVPLEILHFAPATTLALVGQARLRSDQPTPDGGLIADYYGAIGEPSILARRLETIPGVVSHGLFDPSSFDLVIIGDHRNVRVTAVSQGNPRR